MAKILPAAPVSNPLGPKITMAGHGAAQTKKSFGEFLGEAIGSVNRLQLDAESAAASLALGEIQDVHTVMVATAKADLALQLTLQIRNKMIDAYQEISRMQI